MGMYSSFNYEDIKVFDAKGLVDFLLKIKRYDIKKYYEYMYKDFLENIIDGQQYSFEAWDDIKLISYWYDHQVIFLSLLSKYIEGEVEFNFETGDEKARIEFKDGETIIKLGKMIYRDIRADDLLADKGISGKKKRTTTTKDLFESMNNV